MKEKSNFLIAFLVFLCLIFINVGYAYYNKNLNMNGNLTLLPQGKLAITSVIISDSKNLNNPDNPTFSDNSIDFNLHFTGNGQNDEYYVVYDITIDNETFYNYEFGSNSFVPNIVMGETTNATYTTELIGVEAGEVINSGTSKTFSLKITLIPLDNSGDYSGSGDSSSDLNQQTVGSLIASINAPTSADMTGDNTIAHFTASVINSYTYERTFTFATIDNANFEVSNSSGDSLGNYTIAAGETQNFDFWVKRLNSTGFTTTPQTISIELVSVGLADYDSGFVDLDVDLDPNLVDLEAPIISNVEATEVDGTAKSVNVSWHASDASTITGYTVYAYTKSGNTLTKVGEKIINSDTRHTTFTNLDDGTYVFKVFGTDSLTHTASQAEIDATPSTSPGHVCSSSETPFKWNFTISYDLDGGLAAVKSSNTSTSAVKWSRYETTLSANYNISNVSIKMGGTDITSSAYNSSTKKVTISSVTGDISITAQACLVEGTLISTYKGYKKIEDITYDDLLLVYNHINGRFTYTYPIWIEKKNTSSNYEKIIFEDNTSLKVVGHHSLYDVNKKRYVDALTELKVGDEVYKVSNNQLLPIKVKEINYINESVNYYNVVSTYFYNIIAENILTTDNTSSISNIYGFKDNAIYSDNFNKISLGNKLPNDSVSIPQYLYKGLNLQNAFVLVGKELDLQFLSSYVDNNTIKPCGYWNVFINGTETKVKEGTIIKLPLNSKVKYYYDTGSNTYYMPGEMVTIYHGTYFENIYK